MSLKCDQFVLRDMAKLRYKYLGLKVANKAIFKGQVLHTYDKHTKLKSMKSKASTNMYQRLPNLLSSNIFSAETVTAPSRTAGYIRLRSKNLSQM